jgi:DNA primase
LSHYIPDHLIEEIRSQSDILDIISADVLLKKSGQNYEGLCPFHSEKTPSFVVSPEKQMFHCFGCHESGDLIAFAEKVEQLTFVEAVERTAVPSIEIFVVLEETDVL